jgi:hypothetical protein
MEPLVVTSPSAIADKIVQAAEAIPFLEMLKGREGTRTVIGAFGKLGHDLG